MFSPNSRSAMWQLSDLSSMHTVSRPGKGCMNVGQMHALAYRPDWNYINWPSNSTAQTNLMV